MVQTFSTRCKICRRKRWFVENEPEPEYCQYHEDEDQFELSFSGLNRDEFCDHNWTAAVVPTYEGIKLTMKCRKCGKKDKSWTV